MSVASRIMKSVASLVAETPMAASAPPAAPPPISAPPPAANEPMPAPSPIVLEAPPTAAAFIAELSMLVAQRKQLEDREKRVKGWLHEQLQEAGVNAYTCASGVVTVVTTPGYMRDPQPAKMVKGTSYLTYAPLKATAPSEPLVPQPPAAA